MKGLLLTWPVSTSALLTLCRGSQPQSVHITLQERRTMSTWSYWERRGTVEPNSMVELGMLGARKSLKDLLWELVKNFIHSVTTLKQELSPMDPLRSFRGGLMDFTFVPY